MKLLILLSAAVLLSFESSFCAETDEEVAARNVAYSVAGAFTNDGFKLREGHWNGRIEPGKPRLIQVNLYAGNQYWFSVGTSPARKVVLAVYDELGKPLKSEPYAEDGKAAAGFSPASSGPYYVRVNETEGGPSAFCLLYSYK